jgi:hypothetical protein
MTFRLRTLIGVFPSLVLSAALFSSSTPGQELPSAKDIAESGSFAEREYQNKLLGFTISIPDGWTLFSDDLNKNALNRGLEKLSANKSKETKMALDESVSNTRVLFQTSPFPYGKKGNTGVLTCGVERLPGSYTKEEYLESGKRLALQKPKTHIVKDLYPVTLGGVDFVALDLECETNGVAATQQYLVTVRNNVVLYFITTLFDGEYKRAIADSLKTFKFEK